MYIVHVRFNGGLSKKSGRKTRQDAKELAWNMKALYPRATVRIVAA
jgi:hypothetical protein